MITLERNMNLPFPSEKERGLFLHDFVSRRSLEKGSLNYILKVKGNSDAKKKSPKKLFSKTKIRIRKWSIDDLVLRQFFKGKYHYIWFDLKRYSDVGKEILAYFYTMGYFERFDPENLRGKKNALRSGFFLKYDVIKATTPGYIFSTSEMNYLLDGIEIHHRDADSLSLWESLHRSKSYLPIFEMLNKELKLRLEKIKIQASK